MNDEKRAELATNPHVMQHGPRLRIRDEAPQVLSAEMLAALLREAKEAHTAYEAALSAAPHAEPHEWPDWYADYIVKRLGEMRTGIRCVDDEAPTVLDILQRPRRRR